MGVTLQDIKNPLSDPKVVKRLIEVYANSYKGFGGFYGSLVRMNAKDPSNQIYAGDRREFEVMLFNCWRKNVLEMTKEEYIDLYKRGKLGLDFLDLKIYLSTLREVSSLEEIKEIFFGKKESEVLKNAISRYRWNSLEEGSGWEHVSSRYIKSQREKSFSIEERLYLNIDSLGIYRFAIEFIKACEEKGLPYYFKFDSYAKRSDKFVIYSDDKSLPAYVDILEKIKASHPELENYISEPPLLTGKINGWIGVGSDPTINMGNSRSSFNSLRSDLIEQIIEETLIKWTVDHKDVPTKYEGRMLAFKDYIALKIAQNKRSEKINMWYSFTDNSKKAALKRGEIYDERGDIKALGYSIRDLEDPKFSSRLYDTVRSNIDNLLDMLYQKKKHEIRLGDGVIYFYGVDILRVIKDEAMKIIALEPWIIDFVREQIVKNGVTFGIDPEMFCFNVGSRVKLESAWKDFDNSQSGHKIVIDYGSLRKGIVHEMEEAKDLANYQRVGELKCALSVLESARRMDHLGDSEKISLYESKIAETGEAGDYISRGVWMQLLDLAKTSNKKM